MQNMAKRKIVRFYWLLDQLSYMLTMLSSVNRFAICMALYANVTIQYEESHFDGLCLQRTVI